MRAGAGYVRLSTPGAAHDPGVPTEVVSGSLPLASWAPTVVSKDLDRFQALVVGPGLGRSDATTAEVRELVAEAPVPVVVDGDGLFALAWSADGAARLLRNRPGRHRAHAPRRRVRPARRPHARGRTAWPRRASWPRRRARSCC